MSRQWVEPIADAPPKGGRARRVALAFIALAVVVVSSLVVRSTVDRQLAVEAGGWRLRLEALPAWLPAGFRGELAVLETLPERVFLHSPTWRDDLRREMQAIPWIDEVTELDRDGEQVTFTARFRRPVVAVAQRGGFLLLDASGRILDVQPGVHLAASWRVPFYQPLAELAPDLAPGDRCYAGDLRELIDLTNALWRAEILDRQIERIPEIAAGRGEDGGLIWRLRLSCGADAVWGRAPGSTRASALSTEEKLENLGRVLAGWSDLRGVRRISLHLGGEPVVSY